MVQKGNRVQVPRLIRWQFKLEPTQVLKVTVKPVDTIDDETFYAKMNRDGRVTIPKLIADLLKDEDEERLGTLEVTLQPAQKAADT
jgi:hypothetical protein